MEIQFPKKLDKNDKETFDICFAFIHWEVILSFPALLP